MEENKQSDTDIFKWFKEHVLDSKLEPSIAHHELVRLLSLSLSILIQILSCIDA